MAPTILSPMRLLRCCLASALAIVVWSVCAAVEQKQLDASGDAPPIADLAFTLFHNRVYVPVEVDGRGTIDMILDTGAAASGLSESIARSFGLRTQGKARLTGNGESSLSIGFAKDLTFRLGKAELVEKSVAIVPFEELERSEGRRVDGVLGVDLFRRYVTAIDYAARMLTLYEPGTFAYRGDGYVIPLRLGKAAVFRASISMPDGDPMPADLAVDSGTYSALRLDRPCVDKHALLQPHPPVVESFGFGIGGEFPEKLGRVGALTIGGLTLRSPPASFSAGKSGATAAATVAGTVGGALLRRFTVILDYPQRG